MEATYDSPAHDPVFFFLAHGRHRKRNILFKYARWSGYCESLKGKLREECLNGEIFYSLKEARIVIEQWRQQYNRVRPYATLEPGSKTSKGHGICLTSLGTKSRPGQSPIRATML